jgi:predicted Zn-dependent peptidase
MNQKKFVTKMLGLLFLFMISIPLNAQMKEIEFQEFDLDNGLHVILHQDNSSPVVAVNIMYHVGSKNEKPTRTGFAHFFEHLMFESTANIERGEFFKLVQNAGGKNNAYTTFDLTNYYEIMPSNQLELALWMEAERLKSLKVDSIGVETQRKVVKEERKQRYENQPYGSFIQEIFKRSFDESPYRWVPIGEAQYIDQATVEEFRDFYDHYYVPNNAVLAVTGDIEYEKTKELVEKYYGHINRGTQAIKRPDASEPLLEKELRDTVFDNIQLPAVFHSYRMPAKGTPDYYALHMLQKLLSGGESSRLYKTLVDNERAALQVASFPYALEDAGLFIVLSLANMGVDPKRMEELMQQEINKVKENGLSDREFEKLRNQTETDFVTNNSTVSGIAESLCSYYTYFGDASYINSEINRFLDVTKEDIQKAAQKYLSEDNRVVLYYLPKGM